MKHDQKEEKSISAQEMSRVGLKTFFKIAEAWELTNEEQMQLLGVARSTFFLWKSGEVGKLSKDTLERLSYILGIYKALQILLPTPNAADGWIKKPNQAPLFGGRSALNRMLSGNVADLFIVRQYLDSERGGWN